MKTLVTARLTTEHISQLKDLEFEIITGGFGATGKKLSETDLITELQGIKLAILEFEPITQRVIEECQDLKLVAACRNEPGANVDLESATRHGLPVISTPGRNAGAVAEYTIGLMIAIARSIPMTHHLLRYTDELTAITYSDKTGDRQAITSEWSLEPGAPFQRFQGVELSGRLLGLVGFGAIGQSIARLASAFGMQIIAYDPYQDAEVFKKLGVSSCSLEELARESDFIAMAAKVTPETTGIFSKKIFKLMKPTAFFINTARAALVDYLALFEVLRARKIQGAAIDVYPSEPLQSSSQLRSLDNVVLSPHLAGATHDVIRHHGDMLISDLKEILAGVLPKRAANAEVFPQFFASGGLK